MIYWFFIFMIFCNGITIDNQNLYIIGEIEKVLKNKTILLLK